LRGTEISQEAEERERDGKKNIGGKEDGAGGVQEEGWVEDLAVLTQTEGG